MHRRVLSLLFLGTFVVSVRSEAYIQIVDYIPQNKTEPFDPALVLTEQSSAQSFWQKPNNYTFDLYEISYGEYTGPLKVNASTYKITLERLKTGKVSYMHPVATSIVLKDNENLVVVVDEDPSADSEKLLSFTCRTGPKVDPGLDRALVQVCPDSDFTDKSKFKITGTYKKCKGCKVDLDMEPKEIQDSLQFNISDTNSKWYLKYYYESKLVCQGEYQFGDGGVYTMVIKKSEKLSDGDSISFQCDYVETKQSSDFWRPIWLPLVLLLILILVIIAIRLILKTFPMLKERIEKLLGIYEESDDENQEVKKSSRLQSLDTFRGIAITTMIFVNYGGGKYYFTEHAAWDGLAVADFVFPWFMFMVGVSIVFSVQSQLKRNIAKSKILKKVTIRFVKLFFIGVFLNTGLPGGAHIDMIRIPGVLQRIGFTFFVCAVLEILFIPLLTNVESYGGERLTINVDDNAYNENGKFIDDGKYPDKKVWTFMRNTNGEPARSNVMLIFHTWPQWILMAIFAGIWAAVTFALPVPGCPTGYLGPGGIADGGLYVNCTGGAAGYIDRLIWHNNIYRHPTCMPMYRTTQYFDPEGILGSLMAILTVYSGVIAGQVIQLNKSSRSGILIRLGLLSVASLVIGIILCKGQFTGGWVPINKNLWSPSFVFITSGSSYGILAILYVLIDAQRLISGCPFSAAGKNPLLIYIGSYILYNYFPFNFYTSETHGMLMLQAIVGTICWILVGLYLDWKKIYYRI